MSLVDLIRPGGLTQLIQAKREIRRPYLHRPRQGAPFPDPIWAPFGFDRHQMIIFPSEKTLESLSFINGRDPGVRRLRKLAAMRRAKWRRK